MSSNVAKGYHLVEPGENGDWDGDLTRREALLAQKEKRFKLAFLGNIGVFVISLCFLAISWFSKRECDMLQCDRLLSPYCECRRLSAAIALRQLLANRELETNSSHQHPYSMAASSTGRATSKTSSIKRRNTEARLRLSWKRPGRSCGIVRTYLTHPRTVYLSNLTMSSEPGIGLHIEQIAKLNKTRPGVSFTEIEGSDPKKPTYAATLEVFHQLHCLVRQPVLPRETTLYIMLTIAACHRALSARRPGR